MALFQSYSQPMITTPLYFCGLEYKTPSFCIDRIAIVGYCVNRTEFYIYNDLPVQLYPSPVYPGRQVQSMLPGVLVQLARGLHPPLLVSQSLISTSSQAKIGVNNKLY